MPTREELIAMQQKTTEDLVRALGFVTLTFYSLENTVHMFIANL